MVPPDVSGYVPAAMLESGLSQAAREAEAQRLYRRTGLGQSEPLLLELTDPVVEPLLAFLRMREKRLRR